MPKEGSVKFLINIFEGSGDFEICEGGSVAVSGKISVPEDIAKETLDLNAPEFKTEKDILNLTTSDIYKELRLRGYDYEGIFRGIKSSDNFGHSGKLNWDNNWISFIDTMLQFSILGQNTRELYLPTRLHKAIINPKLHMQLASKEPEGVPVHMFRNIGVIKSGGVELRGMKASLAPRRQQTQASPKLEKYVFSPFDNPQPLSEDFEKARSQALTVLLQLVLENSSGALKLKIAEAAAERPVEALLAQKIQSILESEPMLSVDYTVVASSPIDSTTLEQSGIKTVQKNIKTTTFDQNDHLVVLSDCLIHQLKDVLTNATNSLKPGGFILVEEPNTNVDLKMVQELGLELVAIQTAGQKMYGLLRKPIEIPKNTLVIEVTEEHFLWVEPLKDALKKSETDGTNIVLVTNGEELTGLVGMMNCIKQEPGGNNVRTVFIQDKKIQPFSLTSEFVMKQLRKGFVQNVFKNGSWGTYRHLVLEQGTDSGKLQVEHAYINTMTRGDLASLRWIEGPLSYYK